MHGDKEYTKPLRMRGPEPIVHGEHTMVLLREPDLGRLRYGLVTRDAEGQIEVDDPATVADYAKEAWEAGLGALPAWTAKAERTDRNRLLLDPGVVETMWAAAAELATRHQKEEQEEKEEYERHMAELDAGTVA